MIAVIADDFSGAAELAGISLRFGLTVELCVDEVNYKSAEVLVISTDSRSLNREAALKKTENILKEVLQLQPSFIYKKTDSVLRGHIVDELKLQMLLMKKQKTLFMPANPSLGRTISNGEYFVNGIKINETDFANDTEFPISSSLVKEILNNEVEVVKLNEALTDEGIVIGEAEKSDDYNKWVEKLDDSWVFAGAGDFFKAVLSKKYAAVKLTEPQLQQPFLYVCGTAFNERKEAIKKIKETKQCVCYLENENDEEVVNNAIQIIKNKKQLILAFDDETNFTDTTTDLRNRMAVITKHLIEKGAVKELFIEGGSTAAAILEELNIKMLEPVNELSRGVVRMKADDLFITVKPGSYGLPKEITELFSSS
jgi:D-threonate/D-erythronate kinase